MDARPTYEALESQVASLCRENQELALMLKAMRTTPLSQSFEASARHIYATCKAMVGATAGYVALMSEDGQCNDVLFLDSGDLDCSVDPDLPMPIRGLRAAAYESGDVVYDNDFMNSQWMACMPAGHVRLDNVLFAPLNFGGQAMGVIGLANKPGGFHDSDKAIAHSFSDIAALSLRQAQYSESLEEKERFSNNLLLQSPIPILVINPDRSIRFANRAFESLTGFAAQEVVGLKDPYPWWPDDLREKTRVDFYRAMGSGANRVEETFRKKNGEAFVVQVTSRLVSRDGVPDYYLAAWVDITARKGTEAALVASERKWRNILVHTPQIGISLDPSARIVFANEHFLRLTGWTAQEIIGRNWFDLFIPPEVREEVRRVFTTVMSQKATLDLSNYENEILTKHGDRLNVAWSNVLTQDPHGNVVDVTCLGVDLTERQRSEKALRESEAYMRSVFRAAPTGIGVVRDRVFTQVNDQFCEMVGFAQDELVGNSSRMIYPSDQEYKNVGREKYAQIREQGTGTVETRFQKKDGTMIDVLLSSTPIDVDDPAAGVTFTALDITDRKRSEAALRTSHERFLTVLDGIDATVYVMDMQTYDILFMNKTMIETFGGDFTGRKCWAVMRGETGPCPHCRNDLLIDRDGNPTGVQVWQDRNPVTGRVYMNHDRAIEWIDGRRVKIQIATDMTDFKKLEDELRQAQKMESIGNLAGGIAHDFNNILFPITGLAEMLMEDLPFGTPEYESVAEILAAGRRGSDLVNQILTFSRQTEHKMIPIPVQQVLKEVLKLSRSTIPSNIDIHHAIQPDCRRIMADPTQVHQIAMNLITNAYHAVEEGGGSISVQLREAEVAAGDAGKHSLAAGRYALLSISDTGYGIDPANMEKIFDPYFTTKGHGKGTGLGLAVVHGIVREHKGDIRVRSRPGIGTTFDVYFPILERPVETAAAQDMAAYPTGDERILLVDDEEPVVRLEQIMLERLGYRVTCFTSSVDALAAFKADPDAFDLVLTDMSMPNLTGDRVAEAVLSVRPEIPVVICTGFSERINKERAEAVGIDGFLMKPINKSELAKMVRRVLDESTIANAP